jgi:spore germination protein YaaH
MNIFLFLFFIHSVYAKCTYITQASGQYCADLATRCNISLANLYSYNPTLGSSCQGLIAGQKVCCTTGGLAPSQNSDGSCSAYTVQPNDSCSSIGANNGLTNAQLESFNTKTWGWLGCADLQLQLNICLSTGTPPKPTANPLSTCGMIAPGNLYNSTCPLNACCSQFGFCGVTSEFCTKTTSATNNPGTVGCQSNCGMTYKATSGPPSEFIKIGYWEEFQWKRPCMNLDGQGLQNMVNQNNYTEIHYSFAVINDYEVSIQNMTTFNDFLSLTNVKKIVTFGGWAFSTDSGTIHIFGEAVQQDTFVASVVSFVKQYNLDGIEIDWEYPGATDLYGWAGSTPTEYPDDGANYLSMVTKMKAALPSGKSLGICAPSSFWYLQNFPIDKMANYLDYIMMMTYDLHGQWDYNINSTGPYLLSHVNQTEIIQSLTMITKAGVPSNKIVMGVGSYARSFKQSDPSCYGPTCKFTGPDSGATPGNCTNTPGYIGFGELQQIVDSGKVRKMYYDEVSGSDILLYNTADWAAYTNITTSLPKRYTLAQGMNLLGTGEWAVDLRGDVDNSDNELEIFSTSYSVTFKACPSSISNFSDAVDIAVGCGYQAAAAALVVAAQNALDTYNSVMEGPDCSSVCTYDEEDDYCQQQCKDTNPNFAQLYKLYAGAAEAAAYRNIDAYFSSAEYQDDGTWSTPWNRYTSCTGVACGSNDDVTVTDEKGMLSDLAKYTANSYVFDLGTYVFPIEFEHPNDKNCYTYTNFPSINVTASFPDVDTFLGSQSTDAVKNVIRLLNDALNSDTTTDAEFQTAVTGATYIVISFMQSIDSIGQIVNVGNQVLQANQEKAQNIFLSILEIIGLVAISFIPDIGPALSAAIGIGISAAEGDTNPLDYFIDAVGGISDIGKLVDDAAETFEKAAAKVDDLLSKNPKTFDILKDYKPFNEFENVVEKAEHSKSYDDLGGSCGI